MNIMKSFFSVLNLCSNTTTKKTISVDVKIESEGDDEGEIPVEGQKRKLKAMARTSS